MLLADNLGVVARAAFDNPISLSMCDAWLGSLAYTMQLYFDFSAYSDMAIGCALFFNIHLPWNFNSPYKALSIQDFGGVGISRCHAGCVTTCISLLGAVAKEPGALCAMWA